MTATMALIAMGFISEASAANAIYFTGSTAFRANAFTVLSASTASGGVWDATPNIATRGNATANKGNDMLFHGTISGTETFVSCHWSGSEAGLASVAGNTIDNGGTPLAGAPAKFLKTDGSVAYTEIAPAASGTELESSTRAGDLALADTSSTVSLSSTYPFAPFGTVGIVPFTWVKNTNSSPTAAWTDLKNITHDQARTVLGFPQKAVLFTGNPAETTYVYAVGRNKGSGTRVNCLADCGYPISKGVVQFSIGGLPFSGGLDLEEVDNDGYESGGDVAKALGVDGSLQQTDPNFGGTGWMAVGYLGTSDAAALPVSPNWLTLNGVLESDGAVEEGQYSYWGNEHLYGQSDVISNSAKQYQEDFANLFGTKLNASLGGTVTTAHSGGIQTGLMNAEKLSDTSAPSRINP